MPLLVVVDTALEKISGILVRWLVNDFIQLQSEHVSYNTQDFSSCVSKMKVTH